MKSLHRAAFIRAYRTLAQGLAGSAVTTVLVATLTAALGAGDQSLRNAGITAAVSLGTIFLTALASFWQGVAAGLPEAE